MADDKITCPDCGKQFTWKPEYAGRKVKCKCGHAFRVPEAPPSTIDEETFDIDDIVAPDDAASAPDPDEILRQSEAQAAAASTPIAANLCPECAAEMPDNAVLCIQCGYNKQTGEKLNIAVEAEAKSDEDDDDGDDDKVEEKPDDPPVTETEDDASAKKGKGLFGRFRKSK